MRNDLVFLEERSKQIKEEIKSRKQWKKAIEHEFGLARTIKYNRQNELRRLHRIATTMIDTYENILREHEAMIKELKEIK